MRYKVAPPPRSVPFLKRVRGAVPLVPEDESDCCLAIQRATDVADRERAREYLTFARALELVARGSRGYHRTREPVDADRLTAAFRRRVFLVDELLAGVGTAGQSSGAAFDTVRDDVPRWERERRSDWVADWRARVDNLLGWGVKFGLLAVDDGRYRPVSQ